MTLPRIPCSIAIIASIVAMAGCAEPEPEANTAEMRIIALESEYARVTDQLRAMSNLLNDIQLSHDGVGKRDVVGQPVKFQGGEDTLQAVRDRKSLKCGGNADLPGFGYLDPDSSEFTGFDIDICRAIAAAVLGKQGSSQIEIIPLTSRLRFAALQSGEIDVLTRNTTWTMSRDTELRADYAGITFYDGQGVLVRKVSEIQKLSDLRKKSICVQAGSTSASNVVDYFSNVDIEVEVREFEDRIAALKQYDAKACDAYTGDKSSLITQQTLLENPDEHAILVNQISREPLGPVVRHDDDNWKDIVAWSVQCLINAEAMSVSQQNIDKLLGSDNLTIQRLLGITGGLGEKVGLPNDFCYQAIKQVGNYKDIYDRHLGPKTAFNLPRGPNALYTDGGLQYPLPFK